jgi:hypothetical protein
MFALMVTSLSITAVGEVQSSVAQHNIIFLCNESEKAADIHHHLQL